MRSFTDNEGRTWAVAVHVASVKRVKGLADVDLMEALDSGLIERFIRDPVLLCDVIYAVCKPEADERGVTDEEFGRAMAGDAIEHATAALLEELVSFSPNPRDRAVLGKVLKATQMAMERARDLVETRLDSGELDRAIDEALAEIEMEAQRHGDSSTTAPASAASIHPP
ncbi:MAG: hypothetical protein RLN60_01380 [Phycisphaerales bacterium]